MTPGGEIGLVGPWSPRDEPRLPPAAGWKPVPPRIDPLLLTYDRLVKALVTDVRLIGDVHASPGFCDVRLGLQMHAPTLAEVTRSLERHHRELVLDN